MSFDNKFMKIFSHGEKEKLILSLIAGIIFVFLIYSSVLKSYPSPFSSAEKFKVQVAEQKRLCTLGFYADLCDMIGDIRIAGKSSTVVFVDPILKNESYRIRPYAQKTNRTAMDNVREIILQTKSASEATAMQYCEVYHSVPAIVFSAGGYAGNFFHAFTDVLVPLFSTTREFDGEVQFFVTDMQKWWITRFRTILSKLSNYDFIDFDNDDRVHCFRRTIVGLRYYNELNIDPLKSPNNYSILNFTRFIRDAYSLQRHIVSPIPIGNIPRLLIISRTRTRRFTNVDEIARTAEQVGFNVTVSEAQSNLATFAGTVNSFDAMVGVHGAGLTNMVFLPTRAVFIQVVPFGKLENLCNVYFGEPAEAMKLRYLEYRIRVNESSIMDKYSSDDPVVKDPETVHRLGWRAIRDTYLKEDVRIDLRRFRVVLEKALTMLHH